MKFDRLCGAARLLPALLAACTALLSAPLQAQGAYPTRPIRFVVPVPPGGAADVMSRMVAEHLQTRLGQPVVVENKPGAGSSLGMDLVAKAPADGYTIGMGNIAANAINPAVRPSAFPYHPVDDFAAISLVGVTPLILVVHPDKVPARSVAEFVAFLKANPGKIAYGSSGIGSSLHLGMELLLQRTGTTAVHVPYKGSAPMVVDLVSGQVLASMDAATTSWPHVQSGKLRALAVSTANRAFFAPQLPPIADTVAGFDVKPWHGVMAPARTPAPIVELLSREVVAFLQQPSVQANLRERGVEPVGSSAADFSRTMADEFRLYAKVVQDAGIKP
jgi:tripartite-type tricarboxylate transporter receptor subunit TctC